MDKALKILPTKLLESYLTSMKPEVRAVFERLHDSELSMDSFSFYTSVSAVFSSKIEGESIELDSFIKHKRFGIAYQPDYTRKIDDLYDAYLFAQQNKLNQQNIESTHAQLTKNILNKAQQGKARSSNMLVATQDGKIEYVAVVPEKVKTEMDKFYHDLNVLVNADLSFGETLFFASMLHLVFVKIHPFDDGNGRTARLIEKWFLAQKLGEKAWFVQSEKYCYDHHQTYYTNIRRLGLDYEELDYDQAMSFLRMLSNSIVGNE
jgi:Fic family protein